MDYEILLSTLQGKSSEFESLKSTVTSFTEECKSSLNSMSESEIASLYDNLTSSTERLNKGYEKCNTWLNDYLSGLNELESSLASFKSSNIEEPTEFKGEFIDMFGKKVIPTLKSGGDKNANLDLGTLSTSLDDAIDWAVSIASDDTHGYSQNTRWGNPNYDCSSLVISAWEAAGVPVHSQYGATYTGDMKNAFLASGKFEWIPGPVDPNTLQPGDVLLNEEVHTELYIGNGQNVGAHANRDGADGDSSGTEISVTDYWDDNWDGILRYTG